MATINEYIDQLKEDRTDLVDNLETKGIAGLSGDETFTELVPQVLNIVTGGGQIIQYDEMPTPSIDYEDKIIQFTGTTDSSYTNGYFYKCVSDGATTPTYSWTNVNVQSIPVVPEQLSCRYVVNTLGGNTQVNIFISLGTGALSMGYHTAINGYITSVLNDPNINGKSDVLLAVLFPDAWFYTSDNLNLSTNGSKSVRYTCGTETGILSGTSNFSVTRTNGVVTNNGWSNTIFNGLTQRYLGLSNTNAYNPTPNSYNPATTKYVDTQVGSIETALAGITTGNGV